ncbi:MAG: SUMF1/EgtB/PvdO family nonheme iron enzyme [SAR324 cluster bacterium]|nr:SUMF1/EgtB/PvdO family nonheme iron enzyme [SAR324 cluster bacterium]
MLYTLLKKWRAFIFGLILGVSFLWISPTAGIAVDTDSLSGRIAKSIQQLPGPHYKTLAISRIKKRKGSLSLDTNELIDYANVKIVRGRRFRVIDRTKLKKILKEQQIQLSESVTPNEYKELGKIAGVQLFIYGTLFNDALVLKAIDVQTSAIAWADVFTLQANSINHLLLYELGKNFSQSIQNDALKIKKDQVTKISFWNIDVPRRFSSDQAMDYLTGSISKSQLFTIIDRENLQMIVNEQKLNQAVFIDESQARRLGELYGVDAFLYGSITDKGNHSYIASLKMMSIFTGVIIWADLIRFNLPVKENKTNLINPFDAKIRQRKQKKGLRAGMAGIKAGNFIMGSNDPLYNSAPARRVRIKPFALDQYEVTNKEYKEFVDAKKHRFPTSWANGVFDTALSNHPVVGISWEDAKLYCQFRKKRLPTEAEWERAIRGLKGRKFPWKGPSFSPSFSVTLESGATAPVSVMTENRDVTPEKIHHLAGNVREFVSDLYRPYPGGDDDGQTIGSNEKVIRGSSWAKRSYEAVGFYRGHTPANFAWPDTGFRCAADL